MRLLSQLRTSDFFVAGSPNALRTLCGQCDAGFLYARKTQRLVYSRVRRFVRAGVDLWIFAGRLAVRDSGRRVVSRGAQTLVARAPAQFQNSGAN